jgi:hypothetical protein
VTGAITIILEDASFVSSATREAISRKIVKAEEDGAVMSVEARITFGIHVQD